MQRITILTITVVTMLLCVNAHALTAHDPIYIDDDADFDEDHGVTGGSGTEGDPYIISGWEIDADGYNYGIYIADTDVYFSIEDCEIYGAESGGTANGAGIFLYYTTHGTVDDCYLHLNYAGVYLRNTTGAYIYRAQCDSNSLGIWLNNSHNNDFVNCWTRYGDYGVYMVSSGYASNGNYFYWIQSEDNDDYNYYLSSSDYNEILSSWGEDGSSVGAKLYYSDYNDLTIQLNNNERQGLLLQGSDHNTCDGCVITNNGDYFGGGSYPGVEMISDSDYNDIYDCEIEDNDSYGVDIASGCDYNQVWHNNFVDNNVSHGGAIQANDDGSSNKFAVGAVCKTGNYWDDNSGWCVWNSLCSYWDCGTYSIDGSANNSDVRPDRYPY